VNTVSKVSHIWDITPKLEIYGLYCVLCADNPNTTQTLEYTKDKYNECEDKKMKGLSEVPTNNLHRPKDEVKKM
jgi:hypothetical protein